MNSLANKLEQLLVENLKSNNILKNEVEKKEIEKHDQLKEIALNIISVIDSFERMEEDFIDTGYDKIEETDRVIKRYKTIERKLINLLKRHGITKIGFPDKRLIIGLCDIVETEVDNNRENDEIVSIVRNGYIRGKELIRAAELIAVKN